MANPHRGETEIEVGGERFTLAFSWNAMVEVEELLGVESLTEEIGKMTEDHPPGFKTLRALFWGSLRKHHSKVSITSAGDLLDGVPLPKFAQLIKSVYAQSLNTGEEAEGGEDASEGKAPGDATS